MLLASAGAILVAVSCSRGPIPTPADLRPVSSSSGYFQLAVPADWQFLDISPVSQGDPTLVANLIYGVAPHVALADLRRSEDIFDSLDKVAQWSEDVYLQKQVTKMHPAYREVYRKTLMVKTEDTIIREFSYDTESLFPGKVLFHCLDNYRIHQQKGYILRFCGDENDFENLKPSFMQMIDSFAYLE